MLLIDVNILIFAYRTEAENHAAYRQWLEHTLGSGRPVGLSDLVLSAVLRVLTHPGIYREPTPLEAALEYVEWLRKQPGVVPISPSSRHWEVFIGLCRASAVRGNLVSDAYFAALAIESGAEWITTDRDYARFPGLRWRHPLA